MNNLEYIIMWFAIVWLIIVICVTSCIFVTIKYHENKNRPINLRYPMYSQPYNLV